ncbi:RagB/SusD family nutrient uptake outer membrane protein [Sphingobacterium deserti]|uniref:RagB/SusD domain protein n=1 Tax=Sphingobacterium deserti TaxID=1229276 RepID=A0A0B8TBJ0_9SPHI|nr:RagB/SusD family nutrient uptake outer membrane protein [Sphingobacterium deserti]KGE15580.1 RagB/SusD domain protein [Sphingobacterium deserti]
MKKHRLSAYSRFTILISGLVLCIAACTNLDENLYSSLDGNTFIRSKNNLIQAFLVNYDRAYSSVCDGERFGDAFIINENSADQMMTVTRTSGGWFDGGVYHRAHYHTWTPNDDYTSGIWNSLYGVITTSINTTADIQALDLSALPDISSADTSLMLTELRTIRAWEYLRLFDFYRNIILVPEGKPTEYTSLSQSTPMEIFQYIENELLAVIPKLNTKADFGSNVNAYGRWTKAGAAALLARLYLNAQVYIGQDRFNDCATICLDIINGVYGQYAIDPRWDGPFDWNNVESPENIFTFPSSFSGSSYHYSARLYGWSYPFGSEVYFGYSSFANPRYALQPGRDVDSVEYTFDLGKPFVKFAKYEDDIRLAKYRNTAANTREGLFLYGYLDYTNSQGNTALVQNPQNGGPYFLRDQVGQFGNTPAGTAIANKTSNMGSGDENSGLRMIKYPMYADGNPEYQRNAGFAEIRLAEIYYALAECKFRAGQRDEAARLLNTVRSRYYPAGSTSLYTAGGSELTELELLDEWGREFCFEGRRRIDLIRWNRYNTGTWWDKTPDPDDHTKIVCIGALVMNLNRNLVQNPGY